MPELPEVETVRRGLEQRVVGRRVEAVEVGRDRTVRRTSREAVATGLVGTRFVGAQRRGKYLILPLDSGDAVMVHLRMSGQLLVAPLGSPRPRHTHVAARLSASGPTPEEELRFVDPRTFGEVVVFDPDRVDAELPELARLGVDPVADGVDRATLRRLVLGRRRRMKALLLDQHLVAGIGNIYADEILFAARLRPDRTSNTLSGQEITRLHTSVHEVLTAAIEAGGSSLRDAQYVDLMGDPGGYQVFHQVVDRAGQPCLRCTRGRIERRTVAGRSTYLCPRCQR